MADSDSVVFSVNLTELGDYTFYAQSSNNMGETEIVEVHSYSYGTAPSAPTFTTASGEGGDSTPEITVSSVSSGDTVKIFSDSSCSNEMGSAVADSTSVNVTSSELTGFTTHSFYANATNDYGTSSCSGSFLYEFINVISVVDLESARLSFVDCGINPSIFEDKVAECGSLNNGATVDANGNIWKLVVKSGASEVWLDDTTGLVWSPDQGSMQWLAGKNHCASLSSSNPFGITGKTWFMPRAQNPEDELSVATSHEIRKVLTNHSNVFLWSSYEAGSNYAWVYWWRTDIPGPDSRKINSYAIRCVFNSRI